MFKTIITTALLMTGAIQASAGYSCHVRGPVPAPEIIDVAWIRMAHFQDKYADFYYRCGSMIGELEHARTVANRLVNSQGKGVAADYLISALSQKAMTLPPEEMDVAYPLTMESIRQGNHVAQALIKAIENDGQMTARMIAQIKYQTVVNLYRIIKQAYINLDNPYYLQTNRSCYGGCIGIGMRDNFNSYADGVAGLAKEFLNFQTASAEGQGTDLVELGLTGAVAKAAKKIVLNSPFRRDYSCAIMELHSIQVEAETFLCEDPGYNRYEFTMELRQRLANVNFPRRCGYNY